MPVSKICSPECLMNCNTTSNRNWKMFFLLQYANKGKTVLGQTVEDVICGCLDWSLASPWAIPADHVLLSCFVMVEVLC